MKIGVISDTHDYLDPRVPEIFEGVGHILHGGDIGMPWLILQLEQIAPVTAVLGNTDSGINYKESEVITFAEHKFLLHHIVDPHRPSETLHHLLERQKPDVVVFGHTHKPFNERIDGRLYFNPGYAGKQRFQLRRSVAILHCDENTMRPEYIWLG
ncbi:MAG TPA: metallophosphoesterase family protein [Verrucomicrobiae bacterium]